MFLPYDQFKCSVQVDRQQDRQGTYTVTLRGVSATTVAVEKQKSIIYSECAL